MEIAILGLGCFWGPEIKFSKLDGVIKTEVGYCGGNNSETNYKEVCTGTTNHAEVVKLDFDPDALGKKYQLERDKRIRSDGNEQYQEVKGDFAYFVEDPYIDNELQRDALEDEVEVVIIGGGFGGMLAAARLREL